MTKNRTENMTKNRTENMTKNMTENMTENTMMTEIDATTTPTTPLATAGASIAGPTTPSLVLTAACATTPIRGTARKLPKEPHTLYAYAIEQGGRVELTPAVLAELNARGLPTHRIGNAAYGIRKFFGKTVTPERTGRSVSAYVVTL